jgi:hypothetical protein
MGMASFLVYGMFCMDCFVCLIVVLADQNFEKNHLAQNPQNEEILELKRKFRKF